MLLLLDCLSGLNFKKLIRFEVLFHSLVLIQCLSVQCTERFRTDSKQFMQLNCANSIDL